MARILIIEENEPLREVLAAGLTQAGHSVVQAKDGGEGLRLAEEAKIDVALVQYDYPFSLGADLRVALRDRARWGKVHVIMTVDRLTADVAHAFQAVGARALLRKPFRWDELKRALAACSPECDGGDGAAT